MIVERPRKDCAEDPWYRPAVDVWDDDVATDGR